MKKYLIIVFAGIVLLLLASPLVISHCQIPCGIYDDQARIALIAEHIATIEKSMNQINELSKSGDKDYNQLTRWVINKENHADYLDEIVTQYFMKQRVSPVESTEGQAYKDYVDKITLLHKMSFYSMKCKQTTDLNNTVVLKKCLEQFKTLYFVEEHSHTN